MPPSKIERLLFKRIEIWLVFLLFLFIFLSSTLYGYFIHKNKIFPYSIIIEIKNFWEGDAFDKRSVAERLKKEVVGSPESEIIVESSLSDSYYLLYGSFNFVENPGPTAVLIDTDGNVIKKWYFTFPDIQRRARRLQISENGTLVSNSSDRLRAQSWCGEEIWSHGTEGFHHEIDYTDGKFTLWMRDKIVSVDEFTGKIEEVIDTKSIVLANPDLAILRATMGDFRYSRAAQNPFLLFDNKQKPIEGGDNIPVYIGGGKPQNYHQNKVAVNNGISDRFPVGSLLISFRQIDLVAIIDPLNGKILWHEFFNRQHDPDWLKDGILVYNNRPHFDYSTIEYVSFDGEKKTLIGTHNYHWHRGALGNSQLYDDGSIVFQASMNKAIHFKENDNVLTSIFIKNGDLRNTYFLPADTVKKWDSLCQQ